MVYKIQLIVAVRQIIVPRSDAVGERGSCRVLCKRRLMSRKDFKDAYPSWSRS